MALFEVVKVLAMVWVEMFKALAIFMLWLYFVLNL